MCYESFGVFHYEAIKLRAWSEPYAHTARCKLRHGGERSCNLVTNLISKINNGTFISKRPYIFGAKINDLFTSTSSVGSARFYSLAYGGINKYIRWYYRITRPRINGRYYGVVGRSELLRLNRVNISLNIRFLLISRTNYFTYIRFTRRIIRCGPYLTKECPGKPGRSLGGLPTSGSSTMTSSLRQRSCRRLSSSSLTEL